MRPRNLLGLASVNLLGGLFGIWFYADQLASTQIPLWVFTPSSALAAFSAAAAYAAKIRGLDLPLLEAYAFISNLKFGAFTVGVLFLYSFPWNPLNAFILASHLVMMAQAFLFRFEGDSMLVLGVWMVLSDLSAFYFGTHAPVPGDPGAAVAYTVFLTQACFLAGAVKSSEQVWIRGAGKLRGR